MKEFSVLEFGAADGKLCTAALQKTVDAACEAGGKAVVPAGTYIIGTVDLKNVTLVLEKGAVLLASGDRADYRVLPFIHNELSMVNPVLYSEGSDGLTIEGPGTIDLNARAFFSDTPILPEENSDLTPEQLAECTREYEYRSTQPMFFRNCTNIRMEDFTIKDAPCWTMSFNQCSHIRMTDMNIINDLTIPNNDGCHFCGCTNVFIRGCYISAGDDCIALSGITDWDVPCEDFVISDCIMESCSKALSIGYMHSIVRNVTITNCVIRRSQRAIAMMSAKGTGLVENVTITGLVVETYVHAGNWWGNGEPVGLLGAWHNNPNCRFPAPKRNFPVDIRNIIITGLICKAENAFAMVGDGGNIEHVVINGLLYERKESRNRSLRGDKMIDTQPSAKHTETESTQVALYLENVRDLSISHVETSDLDGSPMQIEMHEVTLHPDDLRSEEKR